jgi:hypothetical protein
MAKRVHCWFGRHAWVKRESSEGDVYGECTHCGRRDWGHFTEGGRGIGVPGKAVTDGTPQPFPKHEL